MNRSIIRYILGWVIFVEGAFMLLPWIIALIYRERCGYWFLLIGLIACFVGFLITRFKPKSTMFSMREGCIATALSWIVMSFIGCLPFFLSGQIPGFVNALFETVSGFTTTGASVLSDVESLAHCMLFWRSFTHWIGGMGVLVLLLAVIRMAGGSNMNLMRAESSGPSVGKLVPKAMRSARILYLIYIVMTLLMVVFLVAGHMSVFEAFNTAFATAGTGGFSIRNSSLTDCSAYIQWVVTAFMIAFGVSFTFYYLLLFRKWRQAARMDEVKVYLGIIVVSVVVVMINVYNVSLAFGDNLRTVAFQVSSIMTTTGFATTDFDAWPEFSRLVLVLLMFIGACAGSTGGGIKVSRIIILVKSMVREFGSYLFPKRVKTIKMNGKVVEPEVVRGVAVFLIAYIVLFVASIICLSFEDHDMITNFSAVLASVNNIGPGLGMVGPSQGYDFFTGFNKFVLMFDMIAGRLELFPLLMLLYPPTWKGIFKRTKRQEA